MSNLLYRWPISPDVDIQPGDALTYGSDGCLRPARPDEFVVIIYDPQFMRIDATRPLRTLESSIAVASRAPVRVPLVLDGGRITEAKAVGEGACLLVLGLICVLLILVVGFAPEIEAWLERTLP